MIKRFILSLCMVAMALVAGCGDDDDCEGACECTGAACVCPSSGDCLIDCIGDCDLQCAGSGSCDFACGGGCVASCTGSGECLVAVGDDSTVSCPGSGGCDVSCAVTDQRRRDDASRGSCRPWCGPAGALSAASA